MFSTTRKPWLSAAVAVSLACSVSACMAAGSSADRDPPAASAQAEAAPRPPAHVGQTMGAGPFSQFIVKYRDDSAPLKQPSAVQARLDQTAARAGAASGLRLTWKHRMGINADVFAVQPALDSGQAQRLMQAFAADPDVQFIEPDNHVRLDPIIRAPATIEK